MLPWVQSMYIDIDPVASASSAVQVIGRPPFPYTAAVVSVEYVASSGIASSDATNGRNFKLINRGTSGTGTTLVASLGTGSANTVASNVPKSIPVLSAASTVASNEVLAWFSETVSTGVADPGGRLRIDFSRVSS